MRNNFEFFSGVVWATLGASVIGAMILYSLLRITPLNSESRHGGVNQYSNCGPTRAEDVKKAANGDTNRNGNEVMNENESDETVQYQCLVEMDYTFLDIISAMFGQHVDSVPYQASAQVISGGLLKSNEVPRNMIPHAMFSWLSVLQWVG